MLCVLGILAAVGVSYARASIDVVGPGPDSVTNQAQLTIGAALHGGVRATRVMIDGRDVTGTAVTPDGRVELVGLRLGDGAHTVSVTGASDNPLRRTVRRSWSFTVDTTAPTLKGAVAPKPSKRKVAVLAGRSDPNTKVTVTGAVGQAKTATADETGRFVVRVPLGEGENRIGLSATDPAGNVAKATRVVYRDSTKPDLVFAGLDGTLRDNAPKVRGTVTDRAGSVPKLVVTVDGKPVDGATTNDQGAFAVPAGTLWEGTHLIAATATDRAGNVRTVTTKVLVDSTDTLGGGAVLGPGATGPDVEEFTGYMVDEGLLPKAVSTLDPKTVRAIKSLQRTNDLTADGLVGQTTVSAVIGRIVVDLSERSLTLMRGKKVIKRYPIAVGMPDHPTPTGTYQINDKQVDPIWTPPDSPWAAELDTIPAGPGNPLGTRWIGTTAPAIGMHGTYADYSVGTAASHGCMRMHISDVEDLFERVVIGETVEIHE